MAVSVQAGPKAAKEPRAPEPIVEAQGVIKTYDTGKVQVQALRGVDLTPGRRADAVGADQIFFTFGGRSPLQTTSIHADKTFEAPRVG